MFNFLKPNDRIDIVAPASVCQAHENAIPAVKKILTEWELTPHIPEDIYGPDLLCANSDEKRFSFLKDALLNDQSKAVWCLRGGYGCTRLIPQLLKLPKPKYQKLFIGMSDVTALHIFLQQQWAWPTFHGPSARQIATGTVQADNIAEIKNLIFGNIKTLEYKNLQPLNNLAKQTQILTGDITGGNLCLVQASLGTAWQINTKNKILFLEEVNERGYRVDRMLEHLHQAGIFKNITAVILGDFIDGKEPDGSSLIDPVLQRFADTVDFPVLRCLGIGHGNFNRPLPLGINSALMLGPNPNLMIKL